MKKPYWISWYSPPGEVFEIHSPWWISGYVCDEHETDIICAAIIAKDEEDAEKIICDSYDTKGLPLSFRFVNERPKDWSPYCDRFQKCDWMKWDTHEEQK